jgi:hypothetical protein
MIDLAIELVGQNSTGLHDMEEIPLHVIALLKFEGSSGRYKFYQGHALQVSISFSISETTICTAC